MQRDRLSKLPQGRNGKLRSTLEHTTALNPLKATSTFEIKKTCEKAFQLLGSDGDYTGMYLGFRSALEFYETARNLWG